MVPKLWKEKSARIFVIWMNGKWQKLTKNEAWLMTLLQIAYAVFLVIYTYTCVVGKGPYPSPLEWYVFACMVNFLLEKIRQLIASEPTGFIQKLKVFLTDSKWNLCDTIAIITYLVPFVIRLHGYFWN